MLSLKISPSQAQEYNNLMLGNYDLWGKSQDDFCDYLLGEFQPNEHVSLGTAVHAIIEHGPEGYRVEPDLWQFDEEDFGALWSFTKPCIDSIEDYRNNVGRITRECWANLNFDLHRAKVHMSMRIDGLGDTGIRECKTTKRKKKYADYWDSVQWRFYSLACGLVPVHYDVFQVRPDKNRVCHYAHLQQFTYMPHDGMYDELKSLLNGLVQFIIERPELVEKLQWERS